MGAQVPTPHHACASRSPDAHVAHAKQQPQVRTPAVIQSNPEQSKHLETARLKISGLWIDLVNLRSETYAAGSRIPQVRAVPRPPLRRWGCRPGLVWRVGACSCLEPSLDAPLTLP